LCIHQIAAKRRLVIDQMLRYAFAITNRMTSQKDRRTALRARTME
jgi:hypothetical protein